MGFFDWVRGKIGKPAARSAGTLQRQTRKPPETP